MRKERRKAAEVEKLRLSKEAEERWVGERRVSATHAQASLYSPVWSQSDSSDSFR